MKLSDVCEFSPSKKIPLPTDEQISFVPMEAVSTSGDIDSSGTIAVERVKNYSVFKENDVLFAKITPCMENGKGAIARGLINGWGAGSTEFIVLRPNLDLVTPEWLQLFLSQKTFRLYCQQHMTGSAGQKRVPAKWLANCEIPVPSLDEQRRIVFRIDELFSELNQGVDTLQTVKQQLTVYRQAVLKEAFEGKWSCAHNSISDNLKLNELKGIDQSSLDEIPSQWRYVHLSELGDLSRGKSKHRPRNDKRLFENGKYPFFQTGDVKAANKLLVDCEKKYGEFGLAQSKLWPAGTLCITIAANIAETCFLGVDGCFPDSIVGFIPFEDIVDVDYVRYFIESAKKRLWAYAPATAQKNINLSTLEGLIIPFCDIEEQKLIVQEIESRLSVCDNIEQMVNVALLQSDAMRQSILKKAFEGGLA